MQKLQVEGKKEERERKREREREREKEREDRDYVEGRDKKESKQLDQNTFYVVLAGCQEHFSIINSNLHVIMSLFLEPSGLILSAGIRHFPNYRYRHL